MFLMITLALDVLDGRDVGDADDEEKIQELVGRARDGDRAASGRIYRLHARRVFRAVRPLCSNDAEAEEVLPGDTVETILNRGRLLSRVSKILPSGDSSDGEEEKGDV